MAGNTHYIDPNFKQGGNIAAIEQLDLTTKHPLTVAIVDGSGDQIVSFGGGTQYTEDAVAAANPVGTTPILIRSDAPATQTTTDGDNIAQRGTNYGAAYVQVVDSSGNYINTFGGGTQYTEGDIDASISGTAMLWEDTSDTLRAVSAAKPLPISVASIPSHAVTNAGTFAVQVDGAALTSLQLIDDVVYTDDTSTHATGTSKGALLMAAATPTDASVNANDIGAVAMTTDRKLHVSIQDAIPAGTNNIGDIDIVSGTVTTVSTVTNLSQQGGVAISLNTGVRDTGTQRVTIATNDLVPVSIASGQVASGAIASGAIASGAVASGAFASGSVSDGAVVTLGAKADAKSTATDTTAVTIMQVLKQISASVQAPPSQAVTNAGTFVVQENGTQVQVDDAAFSPATSKIVMSGYEADESSTDSVDEGDGGAARMTLDRKQIVTIQPHTAGGLSVFNGTSSDGGTALTSTAQAISAAAGQVYGWYIYNPNATAQFVQLYNTAQASVTVGTTNPLFMLTIPPGQAANVNFVQGIAFSNAGFSCSATSTAGGNGAPTTALDAVIFYK